MRQIAKHAYLIGLFLLLAAAGSFQGFPRIKLTAPIVFYVNGDSGASHTCGSSTCLAGNLSNNGLSISKPYLTLQQAFNIINQNYDLAGYTPTIQLSDAAAGTPAAANYAATCNNTTTLNGMGAWIAGVLVVIQGNSSTPTSVNMTAPNGGSGLLINDGCKVQIKNFQINDAGSAVAALQATEGGIIDAQGITYGSFNSSAFHNFATKDGIINFQLINTVAGNSGQFVHSDFNGIIFAKTGATIAIPSALAFTTTAVASHGGRLQQFTGSTFTGSGLAGTTGQRASITTGASLNSTSGCNQTFPGSTPCAFGTYGSDDAGTSQAPLVLGQSHIPFVLVSSGSMGNNGALSALTAIATTYPNAYVYLPAGAISSGSLAGWYYAVFSSATAATVYNNTYTSGTPAIPSSPTAFVTTGPGAYTQTTGSNIAAYTLSIAGNTIGVNGTLLRTALTTNNNSAGAKTLTNSYSSYNFVSFSYTAILAAFNTVGFVNRGVTNVQVGLPSTGVAGGGTAPVFGAIDTTASQNFVENLQLAVATDTMTLESVAVELVPGVP